MVLTLSYLLCVFKLFPDALQTVTKKIVQSRANSTLVGVLTILLLFISSFANMVGTTAPQFVSFVPCNGLFATTMTWGKGFGTVSAWAPPVCPSSHLPRTSSLISDVYWYCVKLFSIAVRVIKNNLHAGTTVYAKLQMKKIRKINRKLSNKKEIPKILEILRSHKLNVMTIPAPVACYSSLKYESVRCQSRTGVALCATHCLCSVAFFVLLVHSYDWLPAGLFEPVVAHCHTTTSF